MKQIEREWKIEQDDATDDEVSLTVRLKDVELIVLRIMFYRRLILTSRLRVVMTASVQSSPPVAEHMLRPTESL
jgi:hypothetical protein